MKQVETYLILFFSIECIFYHYDSKGIFSKGIAEKSDNYQETILLNVLFSTARIIRCHGFQLTHSNIMVHIYC